MVVSFIFAQVFSSVVGMGLWMGFAIFVAVLLFFLGIMTHASREHDTESERVRRLTEFRSLQSPEFNEEDDL
jgi:hypothetical protein